MERRKPRFHYLSVKDLKDMLNEYPDDAKIDIWLTSKIVHKRKGLNYISEPCVEGHIQGVDMVYQAQHSDESTYVHIIGSVACIEWPNTDDPEYYDD